MPFVARYRKEVTGGLDDTQLSIETRLGYLRELNDRRQTILNQLKNKKADARIAIFN